MNAVEELQAAIDKLEQLKADSTPGSWNVQQFFSLDDDSFSYGADADDSFEVFSNAIEEDAELIVTLHRTIDAQLEWLRDQLDRMRREQNVEGIPLHYRHALALAEAILWGVS